MKLTAGHHSLIWRAPEMMDDIGRRRVAYDAKVFWRAPFEASSFRFIYISGSLHLVVPMHNYGGHLVV